MTVEVYDGPGTETYRSSRFTVEIIGASGLSAGSPYVYGVARAAEYTVSGFWTIGDSPEMSFVTIGTDETVTAVVTLVSGPITTYRVYPQALGYPVALAAGKLHILLPARSKVWVEVNFDEGNLTSAASVEARGNPLFIYADNLKPAISGTVVTYDGTQVSAATGQTLYFGPGVWDLTAGTWGDKLFPIDDGAGVYLDGGAWVIGSFENRGSDNCTVQGPGVLSGEWTTPEIVHALAGGWAVKYEYSMFVGLTYGFTTVCTGNVMSGITIVNTPWHAMADGWNELNDVKVINPWFSNCDGIKGNADASVGGVWTADHCFCWSGDDTYDLSVWRGSGVVSNCIGATTGSSIFLFGYGSQNPAWWDYEQTVTDNYVVCVVDYYDTGIGPEGGEVIKAWADETLDHSDWGIPNVTIDGLYIEGPVMRCPLIGLKNKADPWTSAEEAAGQIYNWSVSHVRTQQTPADMSMIHGLDAVNTPHDITFDNIVLGDVVITAKNYQLYFDVNAHPYNITFLSTEARLIMTEQTGTYPQPQASGAHEKHVAPSSGIVNRCFTQAVASDGNCLIDGEAVGAASAWTSLSLGSNTPVCIGTLVAQVVQAVPAAADIQLRVTGFDQFGNRVVEVTPVITLAAKTNNFIYLSYVFSYVELIEYEATVLDIAADTIDIGNLWDWTQTVDANNAHSGGDNLGLALPYEPAAWQGTQGNRVRYPHPYPQEARGVFTLTGLPTAAQTVTIGTVAYTWRASVSTTANEVLIGSDAAACALNLAYAIRADAANGTKFGSLTTAHPTVYVKDLPTTGALTINSRNKTSVSNRIATTDTSSNGSWANATMIDGASPNGEVLSIQTRNVTDNAAGRTCVTLGRRMFEIGLGATGWYSPRAKWRPVAQADVPLWATTDNVICTVNMRPQFLRV